MFKTIMKLLHYFLFIFSLHVFKSTPVCKKFGCVFGCLTATDYMAVSQPYNLWLDGFYINPLKGWLTLCSEPLPCPQVARRVPGTDHHGPAHVHPQPAESSQSCPDCWAVTHHLWPSRHWSASGHGGAHGAPWVSQSTPWRRMWRGPRWLFPVWWKTTWA